MRQILIPPLITALMAAAATAAPPRYTLTDLGVETVASDINDLGQVVGSAGNHAFLYSGGTTTFFDVPGKVASAATAINDAGDIVGEAWAATGGFDFPTAFLYRNQQITELDLGTRSSARDVNDSGEILARTWDDTTAIHDFVISGNQTAEIICPPAFRYFYAIALNNAGQVLGSCSPTGGTYGHAALYHNGAVTDLGALPGQVQSAASALNDLGQVAGSSGFYQDSRAFLYADGVMTPFPAFPGATSHTAKDINNAGIAVGYAQFPDLTNRALLYYAGQTLDLNTLVIPNDTTLTLLRAYAINDSGQIIGWASDPSGNDHAFLLTPDLIPEPSLLPLATTPLLLLLLVRRRRYVI